MSSYEGGLVTAYYVYSVVVIMYVLGISGSPTKNANTDKLVKAVLEATGAKIEFIKLSDHSILPCTACMKCVHTNKCVIQDDFRVIGEKVREADALVVGSPTYYGTASAYTKAFMERLYSFRHLNLLMKGKLGAAVAVGSACEQNVSDWLAGVMYFGGMEVVGKLSAKGTICCSACGVGEGCAYATWNAYCKEFAGQDYGLKEAYKDYLEILPDNVPYVKGSARILERYRDVQKEPEVMAKAVELGRQLRARFDDNQK